MNDPLRSDAAVGRFARVLGVATVLDAVDRLDLVAVASDRERFRVPVSITGVELPAPVVPMELALAIVFLWIAGGATLVLAPASPRRLGLGAGAVAIASGATLTADQQFYANHTYLIGLVASVLAVTSLTRTDRVLGFVVRSHISIVYVVAALAKFRGPWWSGDILIRSFDGPVGGRLVAELPERSVMALAAMTIVVELGLAVAIWWPSQRAVVFGAACGFHLGIAILLGPDLGLASFGVAMLSHFALPASPAIAEHPPTPPPPWVPS